VAPILLEKPFLQLRRLIGNLTDEPGMEEIHRLRTRSQTVCSLLDVLRTVDPPAALRLRKAILRIDKAAGRVRDLDVTGRIALTLRSRQFCASIEELERRIEKRRRRAAADLADKVHRQRQSLRRALKEYRKAISAPPAKSSAVLPANCVRRSIRVCIGQLARGPEPDASHLHSFRLRVKHLRNLLRFEPDAAPRLMALLERARTSIGAWHDWVHLAEVVQKRLPAPHDPALVARIDAVTARKLGVALKAARSLRALLARRSAASGRNAAQRPCKAA